jgi:predicted Fe-Mo cluster-binding NifX family protein
MKIAIPVKTDRENPAVAPLFGKAKWFAFIEDGKVSIERNNADGGQAVVTWFVQSGVDTVIMQEMGTLPYEMIKSRGGITLYHSGFERTTLDEVLIKFNNGELLQLDDKRMAEIIRHHEGSHSHGAHHYHGKSHHHR